LFGDEGSRRHEPLDLAIVDVQDIESAAPFSWSTNQWDEALREYALRARTSPEEFERAIRGTKLDASVLLEDGWLPVEEPPDPAFQVMDDSVDVGMMDSAGHALAAGASAYLAAYKHPERLIDAVKDLFQSLELLLKVRLQVTNPLGLRDHPNNPTVLNRLEAAGVTLSSSEADTVTQIRRLRNDLQHNTARFNHRRILSLCRSAIIVIDRFVIDELNEWAGDVIPSGQQHRQVNAGVRLAEHRGDERAGQSHPLRHRRDRHALRNCRLGHQATNLPGPPRPGRHREHQRAQDGCTPDSAPDVKPRTAPMTRRLRLRPRARLRAAASTPVRGHLRHAVYRGKAQVHLRADQQVRGLVKSTRAWSHARRCPTDHVRIPGCLPTGDAALYGAGRRQDGWVRNAIKPGVPNGHEHTMPGVG
jgi:hypothetical protein